MFVFIWGNKGYNDHLGYIIGECPACHQSAPLAVYQLRKKFTVYFIPTFSYSKKQAIVCGRCGASFEVPKDMQRKLAEEIMSQEQLSRMIARFEEAHRKADRTNMTEEQRARLITQIAKESLAELGTKAAETKTIPSGEKATYCTKCGHELGADDVFCPKCGTKRKRVRGS